MPVCMRGKKFQATVNFNGQRYRKQFATAQDAQIWELETKTNLVTGKCPENSSSIVPDLPTTLGEAIEYTYKHAWRALTSGDEMRRNALMVAEFLGKDCLLNDITTAVMRELIDKFKEKNNKNGTINRKLTAISKILSLAEEMEIINKRPKIPFLKEEKHRIKWYTDEELTRIIEFCFTNGNSIFANYIRFMADTGLRQGEAYALRWEDQKWPDAICIATSKNGMPRSVPLTKGAQVAMSYMKTYFDMKKDNWSCSTIPNPHGPWATLTPGLLRMHWAEVRKHMGWEDDPQAVLHTLRHTFCSRLIQKGAPLKMVQELAGHKRIDMTLRYAHLAPHNLTNCINLLEEES